MKRYVTGTHALFWFLRNDRRLSRFARSVFLRAYDGMDQIIVPSIVLVESVFLMQRHRVAFDAVAEVLALPDDATASVTVYPLTAAIARECAAFGSANIPEMPDRVIAATARHLDLPLLSADPVITASGLVAVAW